MLVIGAQACTVEISTFPPVTTTSVGGSPPTTAITGVAAPAGPIPNYELFEITVDVDGHFDNPYDRREVALNASFTRPNGSTVEVAGFWDGVDTWRVRFTPDTPGHWLYVLAYHDQSRSIGTWDGEFEVVDSDRPGWLQIGNTVDPSYSARYLSWSDGTPWYGRGHAELDMTLGGPDPAGGFQMFNEMPESGENYVMWWPMWANNYLLAYDDYSAPQMQVIDYALQQAEAAGVTVVFTVWGHQYLRTDNHPWRDARWQLNGFSQLTDVAGFFTDPESLAWQENLYRYIIARWAYSPAIAMWQTVTEINGTEAYEQTDPWHEHVNAFFVENDPYRHPTTATMSGAVDWPRGHEVMDVAQVHLYDYLEHPPLDTAEQFARWTKLMWDRVEKPNWVGEYGWRGQQWYPEVMHYSNWASLAAGAAMAPIEWNDLRAYGLFDDEMKADMERFARFVEETPLVAWDPESLDVAPDDPEVRGWGVAGAEGGVVWVQDFALEGATMEEIRADRTLRSDVAVDVTGLAAGTWTVTPYDTWAGEWLDPFSVECGTGSCSIPLPDFRRDLALRLAGG